MVGESRMLMLLARDQKAWQAVTPVSFAAVHVLARRPVNSAVFVFTFTEMQERAAVSWPCLPAIAL